MPAIEVEALGRDFTYYEKPEGLKGSFANLFRRRRLVKSAVKSVTFTVDAGTTVGFLGPNGAGKTTTLKMLAGIMPPTSGTARVLGFVPWKRPVEFRRQLAIVMGQRTQLWPDLPARETFDLNRAIFELDRTAYRQTLDELVATFGVGDLLGVQVRRLSLGERMKMELIASLLHKPQVLFLDEPTIGLDLLSQRAIRDLVRTLAARWGTTVMLTSHYLSDIEDLCERVILINHGQLVYDGPLDRVNAALADRKRVSLDFTQAVDRTALEAEPGFRSAGDLSAEFEVGRAEVRDFCRKALDVWPVADLTIAEPALEEGIARLYAEDRDA